MSITLEEAVFRFRETDLNLPERWFSGQQWNDGTAEKVTREDYKRAILEKDPSLEIADDDVQVTFSLV